MEDDNIQKLLDMRQRALALEIHADPLLSGLMTQLVGTIDALIAIAAPPRSDAGGILVRANR